MILKVFIVRNRSRSCHDGLRKHRPVLHSASHRHSLVGLLRMQCNSSSPNLPPPPAPTTISIETDCQGILLPVYLLSLGESQYILCNIAHPPTLLFADCRLRRQHLGGTYGIKGILSLSKALSDARRPWVSSKRRPLIQNWSRYLLIAGLGGISRSAAPPPTLSLVTAPKTSHELAKASEYTALLSSRTLC